MKKPLDTADVLIYLEHVCVRVYMCEKASAPAAVSYLCAMPVTVYA